MRIELELYNSIINSPLFPSGSNMLGGYDEIKHQLGKTPSNIDEAKDWIRKAVGNKVTFTYAIIPQALPSSVFVNPQKSEYIAEINSESIISSSNPSSSEAYLIN